MSPSPFSKKQREEPHTKGDDTTIKVTNSSLVCEFCFGETTEGTYVPSGKRLFWDCAECGKANAVKGIEL